MSVILGAISVCECCMFVHANGECCADDHEREPLNLIGDGRSVTMGLTEDEHAENCTPADREDGCDCESQGFSWQSCEGCGSSLGGDRFALTLWDETK